MSKNDDSPLLHRSKHTIVTRERIHTGAKNFSFSYRTIAPPCLQNCVAIGLFASPDDRNGFSWYAVHRSHWYLLIEVDENFRTLVEVFRDIFDEVFQANEGFYAQFSSNTPRELLASLSACYESSIRELSGISKRPSSQEAVASYQSALSDMEGVLCRLRDRLHSRKGDLFPERRPLYNVTDLCT